MTAPHARTGRFSDDISLSGLGLHLREWTDADLPVMVALFDESPDGLPCATHSTWPQPTPTSAPPAPDAPKSAASNWPSPSTATPPAARSSVPTGPGGRGPDGRHAELAYAIGADHRHHRIPPHRRRPIAQDTTEPLLTWRHHPGNADYLRPLYPADKRATST
jgi:hypothetical protein